jgi:hypothetical protein
MAASGSSSVRSHTLLVLTAAGRAEQQGSMLQPRGEHTRAHTPAVKGTSVPSDLSCPVLTEPRRKSVRSISWQPWWGKTWPEGPAGQPSSRGHLHSLRSCIHCGTGGAGGAWR